MEERIHELILSKLSGDTPEDDIIYDVCQQAGVDWQEARAMLEEVRGDHTSEIAARQFPIKGLLSIVFMVLGIVLILEPAIYLWTIMGLTDTMVDAFSGRNGVTPEAVFMVIRSRCALLSWFELPSILFCMMVGAAIIFANVRFLRDAWKNLMYAVPWK